MNSGKGKKIEKRNIVAHVVRMHQL